MPFIALSSFLPRPLFQRCPLNADSEPPDGMRNNSLQSEYWAKAWATRCELEA